MKHFFRSTGILGSETISMSLALATPRRQDRRSSCVRLDPTSQKLCTDLRSCFGVDFSLWDGDTGRLLRTGNDQPCGDESLLGALIQTVAEKTSPQFLGYEDCVVQLAIPFQSTPLQTRVAVAAFATAHLLPDDYVSAAAALLGLETEQTVRWINRQPLWTPDSLLRLGSTFLDKLAAEAQVERLERDIDSVSANLASTYEEISLLYDLIRHLRISSGEEELADVALNWLHEYLPAESVAIQYLPVADEGAITYKARTDTIWLAHGNSPVDSEGFSDLVRWLGLGVESEPYVANDAVTGEPTWPFPRIRQVIVTPLSEGENLFAWLVAFNHTGGGEFGSVEASLLSSLGVMLGIHSGNRELYRQQAEFLADVVRGMTSAIDAKDPYTCGHSDRVARVSVRLAKELGWRGDKLTTLYMAGLLHDIGKIGVDEKVLRKPGRLTDEEYDHIKRHPGLGHKILADIRQLADLLPAVLHHHEQWDGCGYPQRLAGDDNPEIAHIVADADAYDAMTSDRPYRKGKPLEKVHRIFHDGAGQHWDSRVVDAYFRVKDDISRLAREERAGVMLDVQEWT